MLNFLWRSVCIKYFHAFNDMLRMLKSSVYHSLGLSVFIFFTYNGLLNLFYMLVLYAFPVYSAVVLVSFSAKCDFVLAL